MNYTARPFMALFCTAIALGSAGVVMRGAGSSPAPKAPASATAPARSPGELYSDITAKYLAARWDTLAPDFSEAKTIAGMTKEQQADVAYMKQAVIDGRPAWWDSVKQRRKVAIPTRIWGRALNVVFDPAAQPGMISMQGNTFTVSWLTDDMDSTAQAEHGFTKGDLEYLTVWGTFEMVNLLGNMQVQRINNLDQSERVKLARFEQFRGRIASAYYGTPRARRWTAFLCCDAYAGGHLTNDGFIPNRPLAVMLEEEIVSHIGKYPSFRLPRNQKAETVEGTLATNLMGQFERTTLTFAEDKALREAIKDFGGANGTSIYANGKVVLPSKLTMALDPAEDGDGAMARGQWLMDEMAHPGVHAEAATKPATKPATRP